MSEEIERPIFPPVISDLNGSVLTLERNGGLKLTESRGTKFVGMVYVDPNKGLVYYKKEKNEHIYRKEDAWTIMRSIGSRVTTIIYETEDTVYELESYKLMECKTINHGEIDCKFVVPLSKWDRTLKEGRMKKRLEMFGIQWYNLLEPTLTSKFFLDLGNAVAEKRKQGTVFPDRDDVFKIFSLPPSGIKVVILGQDPYYNGVADGYAFSSKNNQQLPKSLENIFNEIETDLNTLVLDRDPNLQRWVNQGVFLLNTILTVQAGVPNSHAGLGWEKFTERVLTAISNLKQPIAFILWGNNAKSYKRFLTNPNHLVITSAHPSPLSAHKGFFGSKPFSKVNEYLIQRKIQPIDWR